MDTIKRIVGISVMLAVFFTLGVGSAFAQDAAYVGNSQCKICHSKKEDGEAWPKWKAEKHSSAFTDLSSDAAKAAAQKAGVTKPPAEAPECLKCHVTGYDAAKGATDAKLKMEDGVQCESCHGPASLHTADGKKFKSGDKSVDMKAHIKRPDEAVCAQCHNDKNPTWNPERYTTADGKKTGFDFKQASEKIAHKKPK